MAKKALLVLLCVIIAAAFSYGGGFALSGVGSKAIGMGGAFRGLADDWSAAYWNPAGLAQLEGSEFNLTGETINPMPKMNTDIRFGDYDVGFKNGEYRYPEGKTHLAGNISGFYKMNGLGDLTFGVAVFAPYALGSKWDMFSPIYNDAAGVFPRWDHEATLKIIDIHPSLASSFMNNKLLLGAGFSAYRGSIDFRKTLLEPTGLPRPHDNIAVDAYLKGDGWGYGANFGLIYKLGDNLQVGISGKTPSTLKFDGDVTNTLYSINNRDLQDIAVAEATSPAELAQINFIFSDQLRAWKNKAKADLKLPGDIGGGFAYQASEKLMLTADLTYTLWSRLDSIVININEFVSGDEPPASDSMLVIPTEWKNTLRFSLGGLYQMSEKLAMRMGFYYDPSPIPDETFSPLFLDVGTKYSLNLGPSLEVQHWRLGYNFEYIYFTERDIAADPAAGSDFNNYPGQFKSYLIANFLSVTYVF